MTKGKIALLAGACTMAATIIIVPTAVALSSRSNKVTPTITEIGGMSVGRLESGAGVDPGTVGSVIQFNWNSKHTPEIGTFKCTGHTMTTGEPEITMWEYQIQPYRHWLGIYVTFVDLTASSGSIYNLNLNFSFEMNGKEHNIGFNDIILYVL